MSEVYVLTDSDLSAIIDLLRGRVVMAEEQGNTEIAEIANDLMVKVARARK